MIGLGLGRGLGFDFMMTSCTGFDLSPSSCMASNAVAYLMRDTGRI